MTLHFLSFRSFQRGSFLCVVMFVFSLLLAPATTHAATITVTSNLQEQPFVINGNCTLGEAIQAANTDSAVDACPAGNGSDVITLAANTTYELTIEHNTIDGGNGLPVITSTLMIRGDHSTIQRVSDRIFRLMTISPQGNLSLEGITLAQGFIYRGGAIVNNGSLQMYNSVIRDNTTNIGGGIYSDGKLSLTNSMVLANTAKSGGGIYSKGDLFIGNSIIQGNELIEDNTGLAGGGILFEDGHATLVNNIVSNNSIHPSSASVGGGIANSGVMTITTTIISGNNSPYSAGLANRGIIHIEQSSIISNTLTRAIYFSASGLSNNGTMSIKNSLINSNTTEDIYGGVLVNDGDLTITNSTISNNKGVLAGGIIHLVANYPINAPNRLVIENTTIADNNALIDSSQQNAGGILNLSSQPITVSHVLFSNNRLSDGTPSDCAGQVVSQGYNLIEAPAGCDLITSTGDITGVAALLGPLADNGGPTWTHMPQPGSPAINAGDPLYAGPLLNDQRGAGFARILGGRIDIGAVEAGSAVLTATPLPSTTAPSTPSATAPAAATQTPERSTPTLQPTSTSGPERCWRNCQFLPWIAAPPR